MIRGVGAGGSIDRRSTGLRFAIRRTGLAAILRVRVSLIGLLHCLHHGLDDLAGRAYEAAE